MPISKAFSVGNTPNNVIYASDYGVIGDGVTDDYSALQDAINTLTPGLQGGGTVYLDQDKTYLIGTGIVIPPNITLNCNRAQVTYSGSGTAFTLGNSDTVLSYYPRLIDFTLALTGISSKGVRLRGTSNATVIGYIEGPTSDYATRTNRGVEIDGVNVSSFFNYIEVNCNHVHQGFTVTTTGTTQPTQQYFVNCSSFGDEQAGDTTSIGFYFDSSSAQTGQGTMIIGCNVEDVATCYYAGANAGSVSVQGGRVEITVSGSNWKFDFVNGCDPWTIIGLQGLGSTYMESNSGIQNWDSANHVLLGTDDGTLRLGGFDKALNAKNFIGHGGTNPQYWHDNNADVNFLVDSDSTGTGRIYTQCGQGSADHGAGWIAHARTHATNPGHLFLFPSSAAGNVSVRAHESGGEIGRFERTGALSAGETNLWLYDSDNATLEQVTVGSADSGGSGFKVLRIPN